MIKLTTKIAKDCDLILKYLVDNDTLSNAVLIKQNLLPNYELSYISEIIVIISEYYPKIVQENSEANTYRFIGPNKITRSFLGSGGFWKKLEEST